MRQTKIKVDQPPTAKQGLQQSQYGCSLITDTVLWRVVAFPHCLPEAAKIHVISWGNVYLYVMTVTTQHSL